MRLMDGTSVWFSLVLAWGAMSWKAIRSIKRSTGMVWAAMVCSSLRRQTKREIEVVRKKRFRQIESSPAWQSPTVERSSGHLPSETAHICIWMCVWSVLDVMLTNWHWYCDRKIEMEREMEKEEESNKDPFPNWSPTPLVLHYWLSIRMRSHLQPMRALPIKREAIHEQIYFKKHSPPSSTSRKHPSPWIPIDALVALLLSYIMCCFNANEKHPKRMNMCSMSTYITSYHWNV